jgi:hypothetical protein
MEASMVQNSERLNMVVPPAWLARIESWRAQQRPIPTLSEAVRELVDQALDAAESRSRKK